MSTLKVEQIQHPDSSTPAITLDSTGGMGDASFANYPGRNRIINGSFMVWQRGSSFINPNGYTADRFGTIRISSAAHTITRQASGLDGFQYCLRYQRPAADVSTAAGFIGYAFETVDVVPLQGKQVTLSFYARKGSNFSETNSSIGVQFFTGTGIDQGSFVSHTGETVIINTGATLTTTWQRFSYTANIPSNATSSRINFSTTFAGTAGANDYFEITGVQLEIGSVATPFEHRSYGDELARCKRYYEIMDFFVAYIAYKGGGVSFMQEKRSTPTITFYTGWGASGTQGQVTEANASGSGYAVTSSNATVRHLSSINTSYSGNTNISGSFIANSEL